LRKSGADFDEWIADAATVAATRAKRRLVLWEPRVADEKTFTIFEERRLVFEK
jgi:hypothetical protein